MLEPRTFDEVSKEIKLGIDRDRNLLETLLADIRPLKSATRRIQPRSATAISLVGTDGGNNQLKFDPFMVQLVRVVDSSDNEYCLEVITETSDFEEINRRHLDSNGCGLSPLGRMAERLGVQRIQDLSNVFKDNLDERSPSWAQVYREITEWAVLLDLVSMKDFGTDTLIVCDGLLRSKMFKGNLFGTFTRELEASIVKQFEKNRRRVFIAGIAKHSKVLQRYRLALALEGILSSAYPAFVPVPLDVEKQAYKYPEYATGGGSGEQYVAGSMHLCKFGNSPYAPVWAVDVLKSQVVDAPNIFGYLLADCADGFPVPYYPQCLQRAHEKAALVDFDMDILQDQICDALRDNLGTRAAIIDELSLQETDPAGRRYT